MKFLLDMPVSFLLIEVLQAHGHEGVHAHRIGKDRAPDDELLDIARRESRVIITADLDFPRLMAVESGRGTRIDPVSRRELLGSRNVRSARASPAKSAIGNPGEIDLRSGPETHTCYPATIRTQTMIPLPRLASAVKEGRLSRFARNDKLVARC